MRPGTHIHRAQSSARCDCYSKAVSQLLPHGNAQMNPLYKQAAALIPVEPACMHDIRTVLRSCTPHETRHGLGLIPSVSSNTFRLSSHTCDATMASLILPIAVEAPVPTTTALQRPDVTWVPCKQHHAHVATHAAALLAALLEPVAQLGVLHMCSFHRGT